MMQEFEPDWIVAMGGGSPIDAAKAMWAFYEYPETSFEDLITPFSFPHCVRRPVSVRSLPLPVQLRRSLRLVSSQTTPKASNILWQTLISRRMSLSLILNTRSSVPKKLTAHTGMDAMTHAIEAYVSTLHCDYTDPLALHAIKMIHNDLKKSYDGDMDARDRMHNAQCLAGMAFSNALLGIVHSMAHKTGAAYSGGHIVHGCANAMYLPRVIQYNAKVEEAAVRYAQIADFIGLGGATTEEKVAALVAEIKAMNEALDIPKCIKDYEGGIIDEKEFMDKLPEVATLAIGDACTGSNPRTPSQEDMEKLLKACFYGEDIDF